jgi:hypothetical protein
MLKRFRVLMANQPKLMRQLLLEMLKEKSWIEIVGGKQRKNPRFANLSRKPRPTW